MTDLVEIAHFYDPEEAYCAQGLLRAHGVFTVFQNEHHLTMAPWLRTALGGYRLMGAADDKDSAALLLGEIKTRGTKSAADADVPQSDAAEELPERKRNWLWAPVALIFAMPFVPFQRTGALALLRAGALLCFYALLFVMLYTMLID